MIIPSEPVAVFTHGFIISGQKGRSRVWAKIRSLPGDGKTHLRTRDSCATEAKSLQLKSPQQKPFITPHNFNPPSEVLLYKFVDSSRIMPCGMESKRGQIDFYVQSILFVFPPWLTSKKRSIMKVFPVPTPPCKYTPLGGCTSTPRTVPPILFSTDAHNPRCRS